MAEMTKFEEREQTDTGKVVIRLRTEDRQRHSTFIVSDNSRYDREAGTLKKTGLYDVNVHSGSLFKVTGKRTYYRGVSAERIDEIIARYVKRGFREVAE